MGDGAMQGVWMLVGLMAAQFVVHAAGWAMAASMQRHRASAEAHFAVFWGAIAAALVFTLVPGRPWPQIGADLLLVGAGIALHRGILRFYRQPLPDRLYAVVAGATAGVMLLSLAFDTGARWRAAWVTLALAAAAVASARAFWVHGRARVRWLAAAAAVALGSAALALVLRTLWALVHVPAEPELHIAMVLDVASAIALFFLAGLFNLAQLRLVLGRVLGSLVAQSQRDALTGVSNRRGFMQALDAAHRRSLRNGAPYGLLMVDIDHFKRINDQHGHAAGDAALQRLARELQAAVRAGDTVGRLGGEEFCLLLPTCDLAGAHGLAERLCAAVAGATGLTVSIGVALADAAAEQPEAALSRADAALYRAKREGRNRVVLAAPLSVSEAA